ncbi:hypothetical protein JXO52_08040 [bacterium]|nr:hypothetical protein [bacterium]
MGRYFIPALILIWFATPLAGQTVHVPLDHWAYEYLERMQTRGLLTNVRSGTKPFTRAKVAGMARALAGNADRLTEVELQYLRRLQSEFPPSGKSNTGERSLPSEEPHFYTWTGRPGRLFIDALAGGTALFASPAAPAEQRRSFSPYYGAVLRGRLWNIALYSDNRIHGEWGAGPYIQSYRLSEGYPQNTSDDSSFATWDESVSYLAGRVGGFRIQFGRDRVAWGPARHGGLMLSGLTPAMDMLKVSTEFGPCTVTFLHAELRSDYGRKWLAARRLEISLGDRCDLGFHESVIYGERGLESAYLNPLLPVLIAEHTLGDRDNVGMGMDWNWVPSGNMRFYGELFIDDLSAPWTLFSRDWGNKVAFTAGLDLASLFTLRDTYLGLEYSRIEPFVYTHHKSVNIFEHYNVNLGSDLEPNSDRFSIDLVHLISFRWTIGCTVSSGRHGAGSRYMPHTEADGEKKRFLSGPVIRTVTSSLHADVEVVRDCRLHIAAGREAVSNAEEGGAASVCFNTIAVSIILNW